MDAIRYQQFLISPKVDHWHTNSHVSGCSLWRVLQIVQAHVWGRIRNGNKYGTSNKLERDYITLELVPCIIYALKALYYVLMK